MKRAQPPALVLCPLAGHELELPAFYLRRRRAAKPARASMERVAEAGSVMRLTVMLVIIGEYSALPVAIANEKIAQQSSTVAVVS